jgi:filamentous hemagglutinin family protein
VAKALSSWFGISVSFLCYLCTTNNSAFAQASLIQVTSDGTVNTQVTENGSTAEITGGETRGDNLFHSFQDFSVGTGNEAFFNNADSISNIFSRVTGGNVSDIDGVIRANGSANLFLINPAGIIFGENASLNIGGSFYGSSASSILFEEGEFSAADLENSPLLTVNAPIGLGFRDQPGDIINRSTADDVGLQVSAGETISLIGGNINFEGGKLFASEGTINLAGLSTSGKVGLNADGSFDFSQIENRANISLFNQATIDVRGSDNGAIKINTNNLELTGASQFLAGINAESGFAEAQAGNIDINSNSLVAKGDSQILNETLGIGDAGNINITTGSLDFTEGSIILGSSFGQGNAGDVNIKATGSVAFDRDFGGIHTNLGLQQNDIVIEGAAGNAGNIDINARSLSLTNGARLVSKTSGTGNAGNISVNVLENVFVDGAGVTPVTINEVTFTFKSGIFTQATPDGLGNSGNIRINAREFRLDHQALIGAESYTVGNAGDITINAQENILLGLDTLVLTQIQPDGKGNGGDIEINTKNLTIVDSFLLSDSKGAGDAGSIRINASESVFLQDAPDTKDSVFKEGSLIISGVGILGDETKGNAGNIEINTKSLTSEGSSFIVAQTNGIGDGGNIIINSQEGVFLNDTSRIVSQVAEKAVGNGGEININSPIISLKGLSAISTTTLAGGKGLAGNINLNTDNLTLTDTSIIDALTENNFDGGDITISASTINLFGGSKIVTATDSRGNAGNISLDVDEAINISGNNPDFSQFIADLTQDEIIRQNEAGEIRPNDRFRFTTPANILKVLGGSSGLFANTSINSTGNGGNIQIGTPQEFSLADTALISVGSQGDGGAGSLSIEAQFLSLDHGSLLAATPSGTGGNITLSIANNFKLKNQSLVSSQASGDANGGNINIDSQFVIAYPKGNSDILANAEQGEGGNININAESLFGIEPRPLKDSSNDINASSNFNLDGTVSINTSRVNPLQGATELPSNVVEAKQTADQTCSANREGKANSGLAIAGRGGVHPAPDTPLNSENISNENPTQASIPQPLETSQGKIQPARGIKVTKSGKIVLTAYRTDNVGERIPESRINCGQI